MNSICAAPPLRNKSRRALFRSNSSRRGSGIFVGTMDKTISRTFSLSSAESGDDYGEIRHTESFEDEEVLEEEALIATSSSNSHFLNDHRYLPDLQVPLEKDNIPREASSFPMETMIRRDETKTRYIMYLQSTEGAYPIFCAQKYPPSDGGQILIKSVQSNYCDEVEEQLRSSYHHEFPEAILGSLVKKKKRHQITYELLLHEQANNYVVPNRNEEETYPPPRNSGPLVVATFDYYQISKTRYLLEGSKPRRARVTILGRESMPVETKRPNQEANGQKVMDFGGRGLETSSKNTQLAVYGDSGRGENRRLEFDDSDGCCLQMVKWKENEFNVDFGSPFDAFHAFAFALAQFDY